MIEGQDALNLTSDGRIVGFYWDIIPWALVIDLDAELFRDGVLALHRAWLVFEGFSHLNIQLDDMRLPEGILTEFELQVQSEYSGIDGLNGYSTMGSAMSNHDNLTSFPIEIIAQNLRAIISSEPIPICDLSEMPDYDQRNQSGTLDEFLETYKSNHELARQSRPKPQGTLSEHTAATSLLKRIRYGLCRLYGISDK